ncbi:MAG: YidC/Oxa1 family insertase periplasmic-domain containing protein [Thermoguttaceae bacterium]|nr:YidC/Oxa1 family insertase periplasmic-domain containing protein [Thermoguttaceae bacterium]
MQRRPAPFPAANFLLFILLSFGILILNLWFMARFQPPPEERVDDRAAVERPEPKEPREEAPDPGKDGADVDAPPEPIEQPGLADPEPPPDVPAPPQAPAQWFTLGSIDPDSPYRMLVTLSNRGASVVRLELSSKRYRDLEYRGGYLGHVFVEDPPGVRGCAVQVVGAGTPAERAGILHGDVISAVDGFAVTSGGSLEAILDERSPGSTVVVSVQRSGKELQLPATLTRRPMEVIRPEGADPFSVLLTFRQLGAERLPRDEEVEEEEDDKDPHRAAPEYVARELPGLNLRTGTWEVLDGANQTEVRFRRVLPRWGVEVVKSYRLAEAPPEEQGDADYKAYHLVVGIEISNLGDRPRTVAYQLDGPTGLPTEGWWYANKLGREGFFGGAAGMRDVVVHRNGGPLRQIGCPIIADDGFGAPPQDERVQYIGVDAQYFSAVLIPKKPDPEDLWFKQWQPLRVGRRHEIVKLTNTSCRLVSLDHELMPGDTLVHRYELFTGPKRPRLLAKYGLDELVYYGWFGWLARPMVQLLHFFHNYLVFNYGLAIIMLTIVVRGCMYPLSHKQALGAQKMQEIQPELKRLQEKYKNDVEGRTKAQQELFRKHNYNPLSGCLVLFIQLPIFMALYRSLMVDVELRQAPLFTSAIRWCSNLAAPDMLFDWSGFMPEWITSGQGMLGLGPYFNLLPVITVALFIWQQKMFMPPPTDEQTRMQQNMMKYMMLFIGILFFKVASGLCVYFIASSLWGVAERKLLPHPSKTKPGEPKRPEEPGVARLLRKRPADDGGSSPTRRKKNRGRK